jgi:hypothetical protein
MKLEDVKVGMRVAFSFGGQYDVGVVLGIEGDQVLAKWDSDGKELHCDAGDLTPDASAPPVSEEVVVQDDSGSAATKDTNPKDAVGVKKAPMSVIPCGVLVEVANGLLEGARKYGRHNYRVAGVRSSVYYDATMRHLMDFWEGTDIDPDSGVHHVSKAIASLVVWRDAMLQDKCLDDRPPKSINRQWMQDANKKSGEIVDKYPNPLPPYTEV